MGYNKDWKIEAEKNKEFCLGLIKETARNFVMNPLVIAESLAFGTRFYNYSFKNTQLIHAQKPDAVYVQSFPAWKNMGYNIKKGEHGIKIFVPVQVTMLQLDSGDMIQLSDASDEQKIAYKNGDIKGFSSLHFKIGTVFDIAQTNYPPEEYPELFSVGYPSQIHEKVCKGLEEFAKIQLNCTVEYKDLSSVSRRGYYSPSERSIVINSSLVGTQKLSTLAHELGHAVRDHSVDNFTVSRREFEADAISVMIESGLGLELTDARKEHLAFHFAKYENELSKDGEVVEDKLNEVLTSVYETYSNMVDDLEECIEHHVSKELVFELERERVWNKLSENVPNKKSYKNIKTILPDNTLDKSIAQVTFRKEEDILLER